MVQAIICDFDFTLADSSPGVLACVNEALAGSGLPLAAASRARMPFMAVLTGTSDVPSFAPYPVHSFLTDVSHLPSQLQMFA